MGRQGYRRATDLMVTVDGGGNPAGPSWIRRLGSPASSEAKGAQIGSPGRFLLSTCYRKDVLDVQTAVAKPSGH